jgi:uncharacterized protein (TIGR01777 family)
MIRGVLVTGATGFIGSHVVRRCLERGWTAWAWSRDPVRARAQLGQAAKSVGQLDDSPPDAQIDAIVNLAGAPVIGPPWTRARRQLLIDSRVKTTQAVLEWSARRATRPRVIVSASAIGFYGPADDRWLDESSPPQPAAFQSQLCMAREQAANAAADLGMRVVNLRIGVVLGADGGLLPRLALPAKLGVAAVLGDGRQWMSWIHIEDLLRVMELALGDDALSGPVNAVAPEPVQQGEFQRALTRRLGRPLWLRVPAWVLNTALGEMAELLVRSQRVAPKRLTGQGFEFRYPSVEAALDAALRP